MLVGVNLLREGLDLPEVSLVAILDADKEGFLRGETSLIQTIGRAARNVDGKVLMYADKETRAMRAALTETDRRRAIQVAYNEEHGITPESIVKGVSDIAEFLQAESKVPKGASPAQKLDAGRTMAPAEIEKAIVESEEEMLAAAEELRFEYAAKLRDEIKSLRREIDIAVAEATGDVPVRRGVAAAWRTPTPTRSSPGTRRCGGTCRGDGRGIRTGSSSREVMLQQTQVARVVPYYEAFLDARSRRARRWPARRPRTCCGCGAGSATTGGRWRCRRPRRPLCADGWPRDVEGLMGAARRGAVHGGGRGVVRVRRAGGGGRHERAAGDRAARPAAAAPAGAGAAGAGAGAGRGARPDWNQAMMELGATVCAARTPVCDACPAASCRSRGRAPLEPVRRSTERVRFEDTDRYVRGRVVAALAAGGPLPEGFAAERLERALAGLERDGLVVREGAGARLP